MSDSKSREGKAGAPLVSGEVIVSASVPAFENATVHVLLQDVSNVDARAVTLAETTISNVRHPRPGPAAHGQDTVVPFALHARTEVQAVDPRNDYAVRVWVDRDGDGKLGPGDLHSSERHRALTGGAGSRVTITLGAD